MAVYRIGWDMNMPGERRDKISDYIKRTFPWCKIAETDWLISTPELSADRLWNTHFRQFFDTNDSALLIQCHRNYQGMLTQEKWNWINQAPF